MATPPTFSAGSILTAAQMNAVGLWLVKSQAVGTGVSTVTVTGAFSADYDNYLITYSGGTQSVSTDLYIQIGGSTSNYYGVLVYGATTTPGAPAMALNNGTTKSDWIGGGEAGQASHVNVQLMGPYLAAYTKIRNGNYQNSINFGTYNGEHRVATSYTSFLLGAGAGSMTGGTIRVYGYKN